MIAITFYQNVNNKSAVHLGSETNLVYMYVLGV